MMLIGCMPATVTGGRKAASIPREKAYQQCPLQHVFVGRGRVFEICLAVCPVGNGKKYSLCRYPANSISRSKLGVSLSRCGDGGYQARERCTCSQKERPGYRLTKTGPPG